MLHSFQQQLINMETRLNEKFDRSERQIAELRARTADLEESAIGARIEADASATEMQRLREDVDELKSRRDSQRKEDEADEEEEKDESQLGTSRYNAVKVSRLLRKRDY